jgi:CheY-like chemotaxis protein
MSIEVASRSEPQTNGTSRPSVLVVDDVRSTRDRLVRVLGSGGYDTLEAADGREALKVLATSPVIDAILLDLVMPGMNGWEFRAFQLRDARLSVIPTLVVTVKALAEHERYSLRIGTATLIQKPFEDWQVLQSMSRMLSNRPRITVTEDRWLTRDGKPLLWSRRGRVACEQHAPDAMTEQWTEEGWTWIPAFAGKNKIEYCCQDCAGGPIRHRRIVVHASVAAPPAAQAIAADHAKVS